MCEFLLSDFMIEKNEPETGIKELLKILKPLWGLDKIQIRSLTGGVSGKVFRCSSGGNDDDAVTVRIRHAMDDIKDFQNNQLELQAIQHFSKLGHFPKIHAIFSNGYCYEYIKGNPMFDFKIRKGVLNDERIRLIANEMMFIHKQRIPGISYDISQIDLLQRLLMNAPFVAVHEKAPSKEVANNELKMVHQFLKTQGSPITLVHGDMHPGNIVLDESESKVTVVDWEGANIGYQFNDLGYFLVVIKLNAHLFNGDHISYVLPVDWENQFLRYYFEAWTAHLKQDFTMERFAEFKIQIQKHEMISYLLMLNFALAMPAACAEFCGDIRSFIDFCLSTYLEIKKKVMGIEDFDVPPTTPSDNIVES